MLKLILASMPQLKHSSSIAQMNHYDSSFVVVNWPFDCPTVFKRLRQSLFPKQLKQSVQTAFAYWHFDSHKIPFVLAIHCNKKLNQSTNAYGSL